MTTTPPNNPNPEPIEQQLASATQWTGGDTALWQRALEQVEREATPARPSILATINRHARMAAMIAIGTIAVIVAAITTSQTSRRAEFSVAPAASAPVEELRTNFRQLSSADSDIALDRTFKYAYKDAIEPASASRDDASSSELHFDQANATNDHLVMAEVPLPGGTFANAQTNSIQHAALPPVPETDVVTTLRERTAVGAPSPVASAPAPAALAMESADEKLALSKAAADPAIREQRFDAQTSRRAGVADEISAKTEASSKPAAPAPARAIVRTVNMNLGVADVRAAYSSIESAVSTSPAGYIESSELHGEGRSASASIVIRVPAADLDPLVAAIRPLGKVLAETSAAQDVGEQLVDLEARLSNAQRFEGELLETLNKTSGAKPNEILEVQRAVSDVRENIERLSAQRVRLARQIALSTIRVSLIAEPADTTPARVEGLSGYLGRQLHTAWRTGLVAIADTFAWIVRVAVGGAIWWALLLIALLLTRRWLRKRAVR